MKKTYILLGFILFVALTCKYAVKAEIYISEIIEVAKKGSKDGFAVSELKFGVGSLEKCEEDKEFLTNLLSNYFKNIRDLKCTNIEMDTFLISTVDIPIVAFTKTEFEPETGLMNITVKTGKPIRVGLYLNESDFTELKTKINDKYWQSIKMEDFSMNLTFFNDTKQSIKMEATSAFVNSEPIPFWKSFQINPKSKLSIELSNVLKEYINQKTIADFIRIDVELKK